MRDAFSSLLDWLTLCTFCQCEMWLNNDPWHIIVHKMNFSFQSISILINHHPLDSKQKLEMKLFQDTSLSSLPLRKSMYWLSTFPYSIKPIIWHFYKNDTELSSEKYYQNPNLQSPVSLSWAVSAYVPVASTHDIEQLKRLLCYQGDQVTKSCSCNPKHSTSNHLMTPNQCLTFVKPFLSPDWSWSDLLVEEYDQEVHAKVCFQRADAL